ncbi:MAG: aspartyl-tRNA(Asn)/glutamyl-tRNA(Gln) amidotransferase subunit A [Candidatus Latescibacterota bacterium]
MDLHFASIAELGRLYRLGDVSPVDVVETFLSRIHQYNGQALAYITVTAERALVEAKAAEKMLQMGVDLGPLHGIPIALKDLFYTAGVRTTSGSKAFDSFIPKTSATVAHKLTQAGTVLLGKTNMVELAFGPYGLNPKYGTPPNPWDAERVPGGSSSGSGVAVAAGLATAALGTDTGGSIRIPASFCGIVGLKPTLARVSRAGVTPLSWTLDSIGPMTRCVEDAALMFEAIAGEDPADPVTLHQPLVDVTAHLKREVKGLRIGFVRDPFCNEADAEVVTAIEEATCVFEALGVRVVEMDFPEAREELDDEMAGSGSSLIMPVEGFASHRDLLAGQRDVMDARIWDRIQKGSEYSAVDYALVLQKREMLMHRTIETLHDVDALICPTMLTVAPCISDVGTAPAKLTTRLVNFLGLCAVSVPCGWSLGGLPIGMQLIGKPFDELAILRLAYAYEQTTLWYGKHPNSF